MDNISNKVVQYNNNNDKNVWGCISTFLDRKEQNSINTRRSYEHTYRAFFKTMRNKELEDLVESDLIFTKPQIERYQVDLRKKLKASSVNNKISALKKCYMKLKDYGFDVEPNWFDLDRYAEFDKEPYDPMTHEEVVKTIALVSKTRKGYEKALMIRVAYATAFRKESILDLTFNDIVNIKDQWYIKCLGKGKKWDYKKLSDDLFNELMKHKKKVNREKIFTLTDRTVQKMLKYIKENIDFGDRYITFHSLKKSSIEEVAVITNNDIKAMQAQGNHSSSLTMMDNYMSDKRMEDLVVVDINYHVPVEKFDELSREELLRIIKNTDRTTQMKLLHQGRLI